MGQPPGRRRSVRRPGGGSAVGGGRDRTATPIKHIVVLMQSGHSFDNYFGTYPGADGIPSGTCLPASTLQPKAHACVRPYHLGDALASDLDHGSRHVGTPI